MLAQLDAGLVILRSVKRTLVTCAIVLQQRVLCDWHRASNAKVGKVG
jgi:hypothetical protein